MKLTIQLLLSITLSFTIINGFGQNKKISTKEPRNHYTEDKELLNEIKLADNKMLQHSYYDAIDLYQEILKKQPDNVYVNHRIARAYFTSRDYVNAEKYYAIAIAHEEHHYPEDYYYYGEALEMQGKYKEALKEFQLFAKQKSRDPEVKKLKKFIKQEKRSCNYALRIIDQDTAFAHVDIMPKGINHAYSDFSPLPIGHDTLIFATRKQDSIITYERGEKTLHPVRLYQSIRQEGMNWSEPEPLEIEKLDHKYEHTANGTYSPNGKKFYFTRCIEDPHHKIICSIYFTEKQEDNTWSKAKKLPKVNKHGYTSTQPTIEHFTKKKRKEVQHFDVIYFSSDRPDGFGGLDIWYSVIDEKGHVDEPLNCGRKINTPRHEVTPYYDNIHQKLFFSSNHHYGLGGYDVQEVTGSRKRWSKVENVGIPVNSSYDDTYYRLEKDTTTENAIGYIVSNRPGGFALKSATCCDDIYHFDYYAPETVPLEGVITQKEIIDSLGNILVNSQFIEGVEIGVVRSHYIEKAKTNNQIDYNIISEHVTWTGNQSDSIGYYKTNIIKEKSYGLVVKKEGYKTPLVFELDSLIKAEPNGMRFDIELIKILTLKDSLKLLASADSAEIKDFHSDIKEEDIKANAKFVLKNVYFDTDKSRLKKESKPALSLLLDFMLQHPNVKIEVSGHTDSHGTDEHNKKLSQRRAEAVKKYLLKNGIKKELIVAVGYGEEQFIAPNENKDGSDNAEGRKLNRRTEVRILSKTTDKVEYDHSEMSVLKKDNTKAKSVKVVATKLLNSTNSSDIKTFHSNIKKEDIKANTKFILKNVYFDTDKSRLKSESQPALRLLLDFMLKHPNVKIEVSGHTDSHGTDEYNKKLSQRRAEAVKTHLIENGIEDSLVVAVGYGEEQFIALNEHKDGSDNPEGRKLNRRTEVKILSKTEDDIEYDHSEIDVLDKEDIIQER